MKSASGKCPAYRVEATHSALRYRHTMSVVDDQIIARCRSHIDDFASVIVELLLFTSTIVALKHDCPCVRLPQIRYRLQTFRSREERSQCRKFHNRYQARNRRKPAK